MLYVTSENYWHKMQLMRIVLDILFSQNPGFTSTKVIVKTMFDSKQ